MADAKTFTELASKLGQVAAAIPKAQRVGVERAAFAAKKELLAAPGAPRFVRGVGRRGAKTNVRYDVKGTRNPTALVRWTGPAHLVDQPTKAHPIGPRRRRGKKRRAVLVNGQPRAVVQHPGTKGKGFFEAGVKRAQVVAPKEFAEGVAMVLRDSLR